MLTKIHFIRHGLTEGNLKHWVYGSIDCPLAPEGIEGILASKKQGLYPEYHEGSPVFTSELRRTEETMRLIIGDRPHERLAGFNEFNFGIFEGKLFSELVKDPAYIEHETDPTGTVPAPGGDSGVTFHNRIAGALDHVLDVHTAHWTKDDPDPSTFVFIHGGVLSHIMRMLFPNENKDRWGWIPDPGLGYTVTFDGKSPEGYIDIGESSDLGPTGLTYDDIEKLRKMRSEKQGI